MVADGLHILLLPQRLAANLLAAVGDGDDRAQNLVDAIHVALARQGDGVADARAVNQIAAADHFQQLQDDAFRQPRILRFAREEQLRAAQGDSDSALLLHQRNILVVQPEQGHIGIHRIQRQGNLSRFSQKRCPSFHLRRRQSSSL